MKEKTFFGLDVTPRGVYRTEISRLRDEVEYQQTRADMLYSRNLDMNDKLKRAMETIHRLEAKLASHDRERDKQGRFKKSQKDV